MIRAAPFVALLFVAAAVRADCDTSILVVDENAEEVEYRDCWQVEYVVHEAFPARGLIRRVTDRLAQQGWRKLDIDPFEPSAPDAPVHAWTVHHAKDQDKTRVDQWLGWFIREDQSRLQLTLRYLGRAPDDQSSLPIITTVTYVTPQQWELRPK